MKRTVRGLVGAACGVALTFAAMGGSAGAASTAAAGTSHQDSKSCRQWMALTFDDGPSDYRTQTLRTLRANRVPAKFFGQGDGTYSVPLVRADVPDISVARVPAAENGEAGRPCDRIDGG